MQAFNFIARCLGWYILILLLILVLYDINEFEIGLPQTCASP